MSKTKGGKYLAQKPLCFLLGQYWETPTSIQFCSISKSPSSFIFGLMGSSSVDSSVQEKEGRSSGVGCTKKETYEYIYKCIYKHIYKYMCKHELITMRKKSRGSNTRIMNGGLTTRSCHYFSFWLLVLYFPN